MINLEIFRAFLQRATTNSGNEGNKQGVTCWFIYFNCKKRDAAEEKAVHV